MAKNNSNKQFKEWWFVVMDRNLKGGYQRLGTTVTRGEAREKINNLFSYQPKETI